MRSDEAWRAAVPLLLAVAGACSRQPATRSYGSVEIRLLGADAAGTPQRLHGEFVFTGVDNGVVGSASTRAAASSDVLEIQLPAGQYTLTLNDEFVVESLAARTQAATRARKAWVNLARPPRIGVAEGQITRVHFDRVSADPPRSSAGNPPGRLAM